MGWLGERMPWFVIPALRAITRYPSNVQSGTYSITSSARESSVGDNSSALADLALTIR
jgi:hypothetical protein